MAVLASVEKYNLIMDFISRKCTSNEQRKLLCLTFAYILPSLTNLGQIEDIIKVLENLNFAKMGPSISDQTPPFEDYLHLLLLKNNVSSLLSEPEAELDLSSYASIQSSSI